MESFLFQSSIYLLAACIAVPLAVRFGFGSVLGYLSAGIIIGPVAGLVGGSETVSLQHFAEFGVVMMLFLIGLELQPRALWDMRHRLLGLGGLQVTLSATLIMGAALLLNQDWYVALAIGLTFALSSTAIVLQTLTEKDLMQTPGGRSAFSVLLTQDIAVIPMLALFPLLALSGGFGQNIGDYGVTADLAQADHAIPYAAAIMHAVESLPLWALTFVIIGSVVLVILTGKFLTRPVFRYIHLSKLREMQTAVSLLFVVGVAALMLLVGLSPALGAFVAGVVLANSEFRHELEADLDPFKGLLLGLFFMTVGAGINFKLLIAEPVKIIGITVIVMICKASVLWLLAVIFKIRGRDRVLFTLGLAQAGEFGFVLISFSVQQGIFTIDLSQTLYLVVALSMLLTPLLFIFYERMQHRWTAHVEDMKHDEIDDQQPIIIAGIGRFGQVVNRLVQHSGFKTTVLDSDLRMIELMRRFGFKGFFGDPTRPELLRAAGLQTAKVLVIALDDPEAAIRLAKFARKERPDIKIVARAHDRVHTYRLYAVGVDHIVRELFDSSLRAGRYVLEEMGLTEHDAHEQEVTFFRIDRSAMAELARLWRPDQTVDENAAYVARGRELNRDLETALVRAIEDTSEREA